MKKQVDASFYTTSRDTTTSISSMMKTLRPMCRRRLTIMNTLEDFERPCAALASCDLPVRIGFEATGTYHRLLAHHLGREGFALKLVYAVGLARTREALHNS